jgi:ABC-type nickel/cobalt efflux system permease component RcnA
MLHLMVALVFAHPVPKDTRDRTVLVRPTAWALVVDLRLEIDEGQAALDLPESELVGLKDRSSLLRAYARYVERLLTNGLDATLDGEDLSLRCTTRDWTVTDHFRLDLRLEAPWRLDRAPRRLTFRESNFLTDSRSRVQILFATAPGIEVESLVVPSEALLERRPEDYQPGDAERVRRIAAVLSSRLPAVVPGEARPALPPLMEPYKSAGNRPGIARTKHSLAPPDASDRPGPYDPVPSASWELKGLLESRTGLLLVLLLSALFGAAHALTPGHGKTLVAAYLVGERGTMGHAFILGITTTLTHTSSVLLVALVLPWLIPGVPRASVQIALGLIGGMLVAGMGLWLLMQRLAGRADHVHFEEKPDQPRWWQLITLGISGGIVPCYDAVGLLILAVRLGALWVAIPMLLAFSAGLASVLIALGVGVVWAKRRFGTRPSSEADMVESGGWLDRLSRALPIVSALALVALGLWMCFEASGQIGR